MNTIKKIFTILIVLFAFINPSYCQDKIFYLDLDKVIKIIRESDNPKKEIIKEFKLSDLQVNAILEIRLRQLAKLEQEKL